MTTDQRNDDWEFYVGYDGTMPPRTARFIRRAAAGLVALALAVAAALVWAQQPFAPSRFEFGTTRTFHGWLNARPYPLLRVSRPGQAHGNDRWSTYLLVGPGKSGADGLSRLDGRRLALDGTLAYRDDQAIIEVDPARLRLDADPGARGDAMPSSTDEELGQASLVGEIVDSKCYLGVMNPASRQVHRDCAIRCISGGIPPMLVVSSPKAPPRYFLLVSSSGEAVNTQVLSMVARPVAATGRLFRRGSQVFLAADPATFQVLR